MSLSDYMGESGGSGGGAAGGSPSSSASSAIQFGNNGVSTPGDGVSLTTIGLVSVAAVALLALILVGKK